MIKKSIVTLLLLAAFAPARSQGNYVATEAFNSGQISLSTPGGQTWSTLRSATPGYFSATSGASYSDASNTANINGYVKSYNNAAFSFPVGTGTALQTLSISGAPATNTIATAWIIGDPTTTADPTDASAMHNIATIGTGITAVSPAGQWDWQDISNNAAGAAVTVTFPDMTAFTTSATELRLVGWDGIQWVNLSATQGTAAATAGLTYGNTLTGTMQSNITALGIGRFAVPLSAQIVSLQAKTDRCDAVLDWKTGVEENLSSFDIQRSEDGRQFTSVATVASRGSGSNYTTRIANPKDALFRLRLNDRDGKYSYSNVLQVKADCQAEPELKLIPNPAMSQVTIPYLPAGSTVKVTDISGNVVISANQISGNTFDVSTLAAGMYVVQIQSGSKVTSLKLVRK